MPERETDLIVAKQGSDCIRSMFNKKFINSRVRLGVLLFIMGILVAYQIHLGPYGMISFAIVVVVLVLYLKYTLSHLYVWEIAEDYFTRRNFLNIRTKAYKFSEISSYQERKRFGVNSGNEYLPNYNEIHIWMKNKESFAFDDIDFTNYEEIREYFLSNCDKQGVEMAPYRE